MKTILITGALGRIGKTLVSGLKGSGFNLQLCDIAASEKDQLENKVLKIDILNFKALLEITKNVDCIVHLAGIPDEGLWDDILQSNISGTYNVFEAAKINKVPRVIFASSNRVISFYNKDKEIDTKMPPRPDGLYGVSKVCGEALGRLYADKYGISVACIRIGSFEEKPKNLRHLRTWISPQDLIHLFRQCIEAPSYDFLVVYGVSANTRAKWDNTGTEFIGYKPIDNAENHADLIEQTGTDPLAEKFQGGSFCLDGLTNDIIKIEEDS